MNFRETTRVVLLSLSVVLILAAAAMSDLGSQRKTAQAGSAGALEIILALDSADVGVGEAGAWVPVYLTSTSQDVGGFEILLALDRPDLFNFSGDSASGSLIETTIVCIDTSDCDPADTTIDTTFNVALDTVGTEVSGWDFVLARAQSPIVLSLVGVANQGGMSIPPIAPGGQKHLCNIYLQRVVDGDILDTLQDRNTRILIDAQSTRFSDPDGITIGRIDSTVCLDPPSCTMLDTVFYVDTSAFFYQNGARSFVNACVRGDVNESGSINSADIVYLVNHVFKGGPAPTCSPTQGDVNCSGSTSSADIIFLVNFVFKGGPPPPSSC